MSRKVKVETLNKKLHELTEEELEKVSGGTDQVIDVYPPQRNDVTVQSDEVTDDSK